MRLLADENVVPAHVSALESAGYDVRRVGDVLEKGASDAAVLDAARQTDRIVLTYDKKDFSGVAEHPGILLAAETMAPRDLRSAVERVDHAYPALDNAVEYLSDWA